MTALLVFVLLAVLASLMLGVAGTKNFSANIGGLSGTGGITVNDNAQITIQPTSLPAAQPAVLTVRTDNVTGTLTMTNSSHGITTGQRIDLYWGTNNCTAHVTVGTVSGASVPFVATTGVLPAATTAMTVGIPQQTVMNIIGNDLSMLLCVNNQQAVFCFDASTTDDLIVGPLPANQGYAWATGDVGANPLATFTITSVWISHSYTAAAVTSGISASVLTH